MPSITGSPSSSGIWFPLASTRFTSGELTILKSFLKYVNVKFTVELESLMKVLTQFL